MVLVKALSSIRKSGAKSSGCQVRSSVVAENVRLDCLTRQQTAPGPFGPRNGASTKLGGHSEDVVSLPGTPSLFYGEEIGMGENLDIKGRGTPS